MKKLLAIGKLASGVSFFLLLLNLLLLLIMPYFGKNCKSFPKISNFVPVFVQVA